eukprot:403354054
MQQSLSPNFNRKQQTNKNNSQTSLVKIEGLSDSLQYGCQDQRYEIHDFQSTVHQNNDDIKSYEIEEENSSQNEEKSNNSKNKQNQNISPQQQSNTVKDIKIEYDSKLKDYREAKLLYLQKQEDYMNCYEKMKNLELVDSGNKKEQKYISKLRGKKLLSNINIHHFRMTSTPKLENLKDKNFNQTFIELNQHPMSMHYTNINSPARNTQPHFQSAKNLTFADLNYQAMHTEGNQDQEFEDFAETLTKQNHTDTRKMELNLHPNENQVFEVQMLSSQNHEKLVLDTISTVSLKSNNLQVNTLSKLEIEDINYLNTLKMQISRLKQALTKQIEGQMKLVQKYKYSKIKKFRLSQQSSLHRNIFRKSKQVCKVNECLFKKLEKTTTSKSQFDRKVAQNQEIRWNKK